MVEDHDSARPPDREYPAEARIVSLIRIGYSEQAIIERTCFAPALVHDVWIRTEAAGWYQEYCRDAGVPVLSRPPLDTTMNPPWASRAPKCPVLLVGKPPPPPAPPPKPAPGYTWGPMSSTGYTFVKTYSPPRLPPPTLLPTAHRDLPAVVPSPPPPTPTPRLPPPETREVPALVLKLPPPPPVNPFITPEPKVVHGPEADVIAFWGPPPLREVEDVAYHVVVKPCLRCGVAWYATSGETCFETCGRCRSNPRHPQRQYPAWRPIFTWWARWVRARERDIDELGRRRKVRRNY